MYFFRHGESQLFINIFNFLFDDAYVADCETLHLRFYLPALAKHAGARAPQKHRHGRFHLLFMQ